MTDATLGICISDFIISLNIHFYKSQNITYVHFRPNDCFVYAKWQIKMEAFFHIICIELFANNYLQTFANQNSLK